MGNKTDFSNLKLTRQFLNALEDLGFDNPTPIQRKAIPPVLGGQDVIGVAQTGTGKTAAFMLPVLKQLNYAQGDAIRALVLVPTKELVLQVAAMSRDLAKYTDLRIVETYGGVGWKLQAEQLAAGADILISTPGRFLDLYFKEAIVTKKIKILVLDEADRMLDMGFIRQLRNILEVIPVKRQNLLFSATFNKKVEEMSKEFLEFPLKIEVSGPATTPEEVTQFVFELPNVRSKIEALKEMLQDEVYFTRVLVFVRKKQTLEDIAKYLTRKVNGEVRTIHSNKGQNSRINAMQAFKAGEVRVLVATDVASRGIDVTGVSHVINFDVPRNYEDYIHRIGRTGRAKMSGIAITFMNKAERYHIRQIEKLIQKPLERRPFPVEIPEFPTPRAERREMAFEIDKQKRAENPDYKGAFHRRKTKPARKRKGRRK